MTDERRPSRRPAGQLDPFAYPSEVDELEAEYAAAEDAERRAEGNPPIRAWGGPGTELPSDTGVSPAPPSEEAPPI